MASRFPASRPFANTDNAVALVFRRAGRDRIVEVPGPLVLFGGVIGAVLAVWYLVATLYLVFRDDMLVGLMSQQAEMQYAYEDRLAALRNQIDRITSRQVIDQDSLAGKLQELLTRQAQLENRQSMVSQLIEHPLMAETKATGAVDPKSAARSVASDPAFPLPLQAAQPRLDPLFTGSISAYAPLPAKPRPAFDQLELRGTGKTRPENHVGLRPDLPLDRQVIAARQSVDRIERAQMRALLAVDGMARAKLREWSAVMVETGLEPSRFGTVSKTGAQGGPLIPLNREGLPAFDLQVTQTQSMLQGAEAARRALSSLPLGRPVAGDTEVTSQFGVRTDPFTRGPALHSGIDFRATHGTPVRATAAGKVVEAGWAGGYGNMVEIDHGHGLSSRYAHLTAIDVEPGQSVAKNAVLGRAGSTGRSTGPHLHYETRIDGEPADPMRFLRAARMLARR